MFSCDVFWFMFSQASYAIDWSMPDSCFFFVFWINVLNKVQAQSSEQSALA